MSLKTVSMLLFLRGSVKYSDDKKRKIRNRGGGKGRA
jgi:hypothetical protein